MNIKLKPELKNLYKLNDFILKSTSKKNLHIDLIVEEIFVNIVNYSGADYICVNTNYTDNILSVEFIDNGFEFNPLLKKVLIFQVILKRLKLVDWEYTSPNN